MSKSVMYNVGNELSGSGLICRYPRMMPTVNIAPNNDIPDQEMAGVFDFLFANNFSRNIIPARQPASITPNMEISARRNNTTPIHKIYLCLCGYKTQKITINKNSSP